MTAQINDSFIYKNHNYAMIGFSENEPYDPSINQMRPIGSCSACWRGYICCYSIMDNYLFLKNLSVNLYDETKIEKFVRIEGPVLNGIKPVESKGQFVLFNNIYHDVNMALDYSGGILIADKFIQELYVHMGFHPAWKYETVHELIFKQGELIDSFDKSNEMAQIRDFFKKKRSKFKIFRRTKTENEEIEEWIRKCFDRKY